jgi:Ankyrin repeats (3 copies)
MTSMPPDNQDPDDIDARYRQLSAADGARPHAAVSTAVLANAARLAAERASGDRSVRRPRAVYGWRAPLFGGLAAAALAGFFIIPRFTQPDRAPAKSPTQPAAALVPPSETQKITSSTPSPSPAPAPVALLADAQAAKSAMRTAAKLASPSVAAPPSVPAPAADLNEVVVTGANRHQQKPVAGTTAGKAYADVARAQLVGRGEALRQSADSGDLPGLRAVLDEKVSIDSRDSSGRTALLLAVLSGRDAVVTALLERGADPNLSDAYGETPLHAAIAANHTEIALALRRAGAR